MLSSSQANSRSAFIYQNHAGGSFNLKCIKVQLVICDVASTKDTNLRDGDVILTLNGRSRPSYATLYESMCKAETLVLEVARDQKEIGFKSISLPDAGIAYVSSFLQPMERILFAAALPEGTRHIRGLEVIKKLDFVALDNNLKNRLTDEDLKLILINIDAREHLEELRLTHCFYLVGYGLEPLKGSKVLRLIDISSFKAFERPSGFHSMFTMFSASHVIPILNSMVISGSGLQRHTLKYVQYPTKWMKTQNILVNEFKRTFRISKIMQGFICKCCRLVEHYPGEREACYFCLGDICDRCQQNTDMVGVYSCDNCRKWFCTDCVDSYKCDGCKRGRCCGICSTRCTTCSSDYCQLCASVEICQHCGETYCCSATFDWFDGCSGNECAGCYKKFCSEYEMVALCQYCSKASCRDCRNCGRGDFESCVCHDKKICSECLARREDRGSLCVSCVERADRYLDGCLWR